MQERDLETHAFGGRIDQGSVVLLTLHSPREKIVGVLLRLVPAGVELRCVALESLEPIARQVHAGEPALVSTVFFPMLRVERIELDEPTGELPSLAQNFEANAGRSLRDVFCGGRLANNSVTGPSR